ncbi:MAG: hypothetical protein ACLFTR_05540 [Candidatus Woesearchaeota archaeon]
MSVDDKVEEIRQGLNGTSDAINSRYSNIAGDEYSRFENQVLGKVENYIDKQSKKVQNRTRKEERLAEEIVNGPSLATRIKRGAVKAVILGALAATAGYTAADFVPKDSYEVQQGDGIYRVAEELEVPSQSVEDALIERRGEDSYLQPEDKAVKYFSGNVRLE